MWLRWVSAYGAETGIEIARASLAEAALDLTPKSDAQAWAARLGGHLLATGTVRLADAGRVEELPGYDEGGWWVQDAAAALPSRLVAVTPGLEIADLCAAPGGKSASLAARGARVWAVDVSAQRLERLAANMARLGLADRVTPVVADVLSWQPDRRFDAVLLDAPCLSTGTIRRHPDILHLKRPSDLATLVALQSRLLDRAAALVEPGGMLVYCTCSLEPEEGEQQIAGLLSRRPDIARVPITPGEAGIDDGWITADGDLRTLPHHLPNADPRLAGMDGFYAARLRVGG
jgi:16S rRNA (cytosine967-C5)-methyltransferase